MAAVVPWDFQKKSLIKCLKRFCTMYHIVSRLLQPLLTVTGLSAPQTYLDTCEQGQIQLDPSNRIKCWLCELVEIHWWNKSILQRVLLRPVGGGFLGAAGLLKIQELTSLAFFARSPVFKAWCPSFCGKRKTTRIQSKSIQERTCQRAQQTLLLWSACFNLLNQPQKTEAWIPEKEHA